MKEKSQLYIGLMSGTSLDGVDAVLADLPSHHEVAIKGHVHLPMPAALRAELLALNASGKDELHRAALAANQLATLLYVPAVQQLLQQCQVTASDVQAIGAHGQTVRHQPQAHDGTGYTWQLNAPALLAEQTGISVVADFRSRDIAAGGQGAPLVPAFHADMFAQPGKTVVVLNLGGIANLTVLYADGHVLGFDCGPANILMDAWCEQQTGALFDEDGRWAESGQVISDLLDRMVQEPYFKQPTPKSTGRDLFNMAWLKRQLAGMKGLRPQDVQATLLRLTVSICVQAVHQYAPGAAEVVVCGGGALNACLMRQLQVYLAGASVKSSAEHGLPALQVEAAAFAWLARQCIEKVPANLPEVTGAHGPRILGALYPA